MAKYRRKPVIVEAVQWDGQAETAKKFVGVRYGLDWEYSFKNGETLVTEAYGHLVYYEVGDWIIKDANDVPYPCKPDIFKQTYEAVD